MEIFLMAKKNLVSIGLDENLSPFNRTQLLRMMQNTLAIIFQLLYIVYDASTVREYMDSMLMSIFGLFVYISYWSMILNMTTIYDVIAYLERCINHSELGNFLCISKSIFQWKKSANRCAHVLGLKYPKSKKMYESTNWLAEVLCKILHFIVVYVVVPAFMAPVTIDSFFKYFAADLGPDAFVLPFPTW